VITNETRTEAISSLGWVDKGSLWIYSPPEHSPREVALSDAKWLSVAAGANDFFAVTHHWEAEKLQISAHSHSGPGRPLSRILFRSATSKDVTLEGERDVWRFLPRAFSAFAFGGYHLILVDAGEVEVQPIAWFDDSYDKVYQGIVGVTEVPDSRLLIISVARDSSPILFDPTKSQVVRKLQLANRHGNPEFSLRAAANEFWVTDYDSVVKIDAKTFATLAASRIQDSPPRTGRFIGKLAFSQDEKMCAVARPFSRDAVILDAQSMRVMRHIGLGGQPLDIAWLTDGMIVARDWKTGVLLSCHL
jgi:hypothetical protein